VSLAVEIFRDDVALVTGDWRMGVRRPVGFVGADAPRGGGDVSAEIRRRASFVVAAVARIALDLDFDLAVDVKLGVRDALVWARDFAMAPFAVLAPRMGWIGGQPVAGAASVLGRARLGPTSVAVLVAVRVVAGSLVRVVPGGQIAVACELTEGHLGGQLRVHVAFGEYLVGYDVALFALDGSVTLGLEQVGFVSANAPALGAGFPVQIEWRGGAQQVLASSGL
jgi:hypothetical protein